MCKTKLFIIFIFLAATLIGCANLKEYSQSRNVLSAISKDNLKGMGKIDVIKKLGQPVATSKSEVSECWYYAKPKAIWIWFEENKVDHWEVE